MSYFKNLIPKNKQQKIKDAISVIQNEAVADSESFGQSANIRKKNRDTKLEKLKTDLQFTSGNSLKKLILQPNGWITGLVFFIMGLILGPKVKITNITNVGSIVIDQTSNRANIFGLFVILGISLTVLMIIISWYFMDSYDE